MTFPMYSFHIQISQGTSYRLNIIYWINKLQYLAVFCYIQYQIQAFRVA